MDWLSFASNAATIITAVVATTTALYFWRQKQARLLRLENYLTKAKREYEEGGRLGPARRIPHLMAECLMTEGQLFEAALASSKINVWDAVDEDGEQTEIIMFSLDAKGRALKSRLN